MGQSCRRVTRVEGNGSLGGFSSCSTREDNVAQEELNIFTWGNYAEGPHTRGKTGPKRYPTVTVVCQVTGPVGYNERYDVLCADCASMLETGRRSGLLQVMLVVANGTQDLVRGSS